MKRILALLLCASTAFAGPIYQFNPISLYVTNRGVTLFWGDTLEYLNRTNYLVNATDMPPGIPIEFTKLSNGVIRAVTLTESNLILSLTASNLNFLQTNGAAIRRTNEIQSATDGLFGTDSMSRMDRAIIIGIMNALNNHRTNATTATNLPAYTTNQIINSISNLIRLDPR